MDPVSRWRSPVRSPRVSSWPTARFCTSEVGRARSSLAPSELGRMASSTKRCALVVVLTWLTNRGWLASQPDVAGAVTAPDRVYRPRGPGAHQLPERMIAARVAIVVSEMAGGMAGSVDVGPDLVEPGPGLLGRRWPQRRKRLPRTASP